VEHLKVAMEKEREEVQLVRGAFSPHPRVRNVNALHAERLTAGQRIADGVASTMGSWRFIIIQSCILIAWIIFNAVAVIHHWDPYPFILLNLALSFQAAYAAPIIMMSQNRQAAKDRLKADEDYDVTCHAEEEIAMVHQRLAHLTADKWDALLAAQDEQLALLRQLRDAVTNEGGNERAAPI
jgi:uncharacterized membrane protein